MILIKVSVLYFLFKQSRGDDGENIREKNLKIYVKKSVNVNKYIFFKIFLYSTKMNQKSNLSSNQKILHLKSNKN